MDEEGTRLGLWVLESEDKVASYCEVQDRLNQALLLQLYLCKYKCVELVPDCKDTILKRDKCLDCKYGSVVEMPNSKMHLRISNHKIGSAFNVQICVLC